MPWPTTNEGVPYYKPVSPDVPVADNTAAKLVSAGTGTAVQGFVQMAIARERAQIEQQQMLQHADLTAKQLDFDRERLAQNYELTKSAQEIANKNVLLDYSSAEDRIKMEGDHYQWLKDKSNSDAMTALQATMGFAKAMGQIHQDFSKRADELFGGQNPLTVATKDPIGFADATDALYSEWGTAPSATKVPQQIKAWQTVADQQKNTIVLNGKQQSLPIRQILAGLRNPDTYDAYYQGLKEAGHINTGQEDSGAVKPFDPQHPIDSIWNKLFQKHETKTVDQPDSFATKALNQVKIFDPSKSKNMVPEDTPQSAAELRANSVPSGSLFDPRTTSAGKASPQAVKDASDALNNGVDLPVAEPDPTDTDRLIQQAKMAKAAGKDPAAVDNFLQSKGIDPGGIDWTE